MNASLPDVTCQFTDGGEILSELITSSFAAFLRAQLNTYIGGEVLINVPGYN